MFHKITQRTVNIKELKIQRNILITLLLLNVQNYKTCTWSSVRKDFMSSMRSETSYRISVG